MWVHRNEVLRERFGPQRKKITRGLRKLHNEKLHNLYPSPDISKVIRSMRIRLLRHLDTYFGDDKSIQNFRSNA
jgi:hypothetical protein